ncbi:MAG: hypothetical protein KY466_15025, partial [Gemmatimonadetes bacterium]|nr:hypothetical protein [Gemmatimonadota bacterium]
FTSGRLWAERDADLRADTKRLARELPDNLFGRAVWEEAFEPATRTFLTTAEAVYRARRDDPLFDFSGPAVEYAKAVETELNALLFPRLRRRLEKAALKDRETRVDGRPLDLGSRVGHQSLGALLYLLEKDEVVGRALGGAFSHEEAGWLRSRAPLELRPVLEVRNAAAHAGEVDREKAAWLRERVLGIGGEGVLVRIARAKEHTGA